MQQKNKLQENSIERYFNVVNSLQPLIMQSYDFDDSDTKSFHMKLLKQTYFKNKKILFKRGDEFRGFEVFKTDDKTILHIYNQIAEIYLEDLQDSGIIYILHTVFTALLLIQLLLYVVLKRSLKPLQTLDMKLKNLQNGDMSKLDYVSNYDEINQIISSYNNSISQIEYILETREMFNKIFMHEMKMPIAKAMFYLKQEPNENILKLMQRLNSELDRFSILESLIVYKNKIQKQEHNFTQLLNTAIEKIGIEEQSNIDLHIDTSCTVLGDKDLWIVCFKNILDNALKYSNNHKVVVECQNNSITFTNQGDTLPLDMTEDLQSWKIDKTKRHKSSTGYGFGLFIIKNIITLNGYFLEYKYENNNVILKITQYL
jgi:two-component system OmpR family sensor kinase